MRVGVVMAIGSPWSADTAVRLAGLGNEVHVIDFEAPVDGNGSYIGVGDATYTSNLARLREQCAGVHFLSANHPSMRYLLAAPQLSRILRSCGVEVLLTLYGGGFAMLALASGFRPYCCYVVGSDVLGAHGSAKKSLNRLALSRAALVLANGDYLAKRTRKLAPRARVVPLLLGTDPDLFRPAEKHPTTVEIICTRGFMSIYNNDAVVEALALIPADAPKFRMTFTSPGPQLAAARARAATLLGATAADRVRFLGGVERDVLVDMLRSADIYVSMSRSDGTSTALLEALACGLFPVLSDIPQHHEWIVGDNAILAPLDDDRSLAQALLTAVTDEGRRARARATNRQLVLDHANVRQTSARLDEELRGLVRSPGWAA
jgi:glycosyltransferase involved in cell wall biosynthesis